MLIFAVASSVSNAVAMLDTPDQYREMHSVTVTCIIHPESEAEFCEAMLTSSGNLTKIGSHITHLIMYCTHICTTMYVCVLAILSGITTFFGFLYDHQYNTYPRLLLKLDYNENTTSSSIIAVTSIIYVCS